MRIIHAVVTLLAAIVVIALGGSWLAQRYEVGSDFGIWSAPNVQRDEWYKSQGVPVKGSAKLSASVGNAFRQPSWESGTGPDLWPVYIGAPDAGYGRGFSTYTWGAELRFMQGGDCLSPTVNFVQLDAETGAGKPLFDRRVFLPSYAFSDQAGDKRLFALVVDEDTDQDGVYSCLDEARFSVLSLNDGSWKTFERRFVPAELSRIEFDLDGERFAFIERRYAGDKVRLNSITISFAGDVAEIENPDLLSEAAKAFEKTN